MKLVPAGNAERIVFGRDITEIVPGRFKGPAFKSTHVIRHEDVNRLRDLGKENIAALDPAPGLMYEADNYLCHLSYFAWPDHRWFGLD